MYTVSFATVGTVSLTTIGIVPIAVPSYLILNRAVIQQFLCRSQIIGLTFSCPWDRYLILPVPTLPERKHSELVTVVCFLLLLICLLSLEPLSHSVLQRIPLISHHGVCNTQHHSNSSTCDNRTGHPLLLFGG